MAQPKEPPLSIRLPAGLAERVKLRCAANSISVSGYITALILADLESPVRRKGSTMAKAPLPTAVNLASNTSGAETPIVLQQTPGKLPRPNAAKPGERLKKR